MSNLLDFYQLKSLVRYNTRLKITSETVAEHSYFVSLFTMIICDELDISSDVTLSALKYAIMHDIPEIDTSDIPYPVKKANPELSSLLRKLEITSIENHLSPRLAKLFEDIELAYDSDNPYPVSETAAIIMAIVKLADSLSVIQYSENEITLGNTSFEPILEDAKCRVTKYKDLIETLTGKRPKLGDK